MPSSLTSADVERIIALANLGLAPRAIQERLAGEGREFERHTIQNVLARLRRNGEDLPRFRAPSDPARPGTLIRFTLDTGNQATLITEAKRRGISPSQLARRVVEHVIAGNIFAAVLEEA